MYIDSIKLVCLFQGEDENLAPATAEGATAYQFTATNTVPAQQFSFWLDSVCSIASFDRTGWNLRALSSVFLLNL